MKGGIPLSRNAYSVVASIIAVFVCGIALFVSLDIFGNISENRRKSAEALENVRMSADPATGSRCADEGRASGDVSDEWDAKAFMANRIVESGDSGAFDPDDPSRKIEMPSPLVLRKETPKTEGEEENEEDILSNGNDSAYSDEDITRVLSDSGRTYYFDTFENLVSMTGSELSEERTPELLLFDRTFSGVLRDGANGKIRERRFMRNAFPPDAGIAKIRDLFILWKYILSVSKHGRTPPGLANALIESAALIWYSEKYGAPLGLAVGVAQTESLFMPTAISYAKARGVMQVMWNIHYGLLQANGLTTHEDLHDPELGIAAGCLILSRYLRHEASVAGGLRRYYGELSTHYVGKTLSHWHAFELYASGVSKNWRDVLGREKMYWDTMLGSRASISVPSASIAPRVSVVVTGSRKKPSPVLTASSSPSAVRPEIQPASNAYAPTTVYKRGGIIAITYGDGSKKIWKEDPKE